MYTPCFPTSLSEQIMGHSGVEAHNLIVATGPREWTVTCPEGGGVLIKGGTFSGAVAHGQCRTMQRYRADFGARTVQAMNGGGNLIEVVCAASGSPWRYASSSGRSEFVPPPVARKADVLVVGSGMAGLGAATAAARADPALTVLMVTPGPSTTARSSGVVWFPLNHTVAELREPYGGEEAEQAHLEEYVRTGTESHAYWKRVLSLTPYPTAANPAPDYHAYKASGPKRNNSFVAAVCASSSACGAATLRELYNQTEFGELRSHNVTAVSTARDGAFYATVASTDPDGDVSVVHARTIIFACGGSGHADGVYNNTHILAGPENQGVHLTAAASLGLGSAGAGLKWGLEFAQSAAGIWNETWFNFGCVPAGVRGYQPCHDYNRRVAAYNGTTRPYPVSFPGVNESSTACSAGSSFYWWRMFFKINYYGGVDPVDASVHLCGTATTHMAAGIIDGRRGFPIEPKTMQSTVMKGVYAAGTSAAHVLGNTYYGPGATLGWALHSGRLAGIAAAQRADEQRRGERAELATRNDPVRRHSWKIRAFRWGAWLLLAGVAVHVAARASGRKWLFQLHFRLAPLAAVLLVTTALLAATEPRNKRPMKTSTRTDHRVHRMLGYFMVLLLVLQIILGMLRRAVKAGRALGWLHRITGYVILLCVSVLYYTSRSTATLYDDAVSPKMHYAQAVAYGCCVAAVVLAGVGLTVYEQWHATWKSDAATEKLMLY